MTTPSENTFSVNSKDAFESVTMTGSGSGVSKPLHLVRRSLYSPNKTTRVLILDLINSFIEN